MSEHRTGLVLSGGGARGAFQVGVWSILRENPDLFPDGKPWVVCGTSAGAINAALIGAGLDPTEMLDFWLGLAEDPPVTARRDTFRALLRAVGDLAAKEPFRSPEQRIREWRSIWRSVPKHSILTPSGGLAFYLEFLLTARFDTVTSVLQGTQGLSLFSTAPFRARLAARVKAKDGRFRPKVRIAVHTIDVASGEVLRWVSHPVNKRASAKQGHYRVCEDFPIDAVAASAAIPLLFDPVPVEDPQTGKMITLWDGGLLVNTPMAPVAALGATRAIPVLVTPPRGPAPTSLGSAIERLSDVFLENAYTVDRKLMLERNARARDGAGELREILLYEALRPERSEMFNAGSYLHFEPGLLRGMYQEGRRAARAWLARGPIVDTDP